MASGRMKVASMASYFRSALAGTSSTSSKESDTPRHASESTGSMDASSMRKDLLVSPDNMVDDHHGDVESEPIPSNPSDPACDGDDGDEEGVAIDADQAGVFAGAPCDGKYDPGTHQVRDNNNDDDDRDADEACDAVDAKAGKYEVTYEYASPDEECCSFGDDGGGYVGEGTDLHTSRTTRLHFVDVLLRADANGLGLNIEVAPVDGSVAKPRWMMLVVASFRRLHADDIGPAEATRQIQKGDILHAIDGEEIRSLHQLQAKVRASSGSCDRSPFLLLRFLRHVSKNETDTASTSSLTTEEDLEVAKPAASRLEIAASLPAASCLDDKKQVAMVIRELATRNQELQEELVASKLKQAEQSIQLDQLYALYARTQVDSLPGFSLSKSMLPFARRASAGGPAGNSVGAASSLFTTKSGSSKLHTEIELAVRSEQERLRKHYQSQIDIEKRALVLQHEQQLQKLRETTDKKLEMLEIGFQEALRKHESSEPLLREAASTSASIERCSCGTWMRLQQELYIHQSLEHDGGDGEESECLVCDLLTDARRAPTDQMDAIVESSASRRMQKVMEALHDYDLVKQKRLLHLKEHQLESVATPLDLPSKGLQP